MDACSMTTYRLEAEAALSTPCWLSGRQPCWVQHTQSGLAANTDTELLRARCVLPPLPAVSWSEHLNTRDWNRLSLGSFPRAALRGDFEAVLVLEHLEEEAEVGISASRQCIQAEVLKTTHQKAKALQVETCASNHHQW